MRAITADWSSGWKALEGCFPGGKKSRTDRLAYLFSTWKIGLKVILLDKFIGHYEKKNLAKDLKKLKKKGGGTREIKCCTRKYM